MVGILSRFLLGKVHKFSGTFAVSFREGHVSFFEETKTKDMETRGFQHMYDMALRHNRIWVGKPRFARNNTTETMGLC